ncbi:ATP-grasp fold amidoligase family protein [Pontibacter chitinilyticus]|uniref:ATP-grasp fold amidoligase family protein n=1 Tax=Pontibacter chitinilyticus TaxID=2674989 RepID=UPI00321B3907
MNAFTGKISTNNGEFARRILYRHQTFWNAPDAELVRNSAMHPSASLEEWQSVDHWQRKLSNKYNARLFAQMHGCRVAALYWRGRDLSQLDFSSLPDQYVIRPTIGHSCNLVFLMDKHMNHMDKRFYSEADLKKIMAAALKQNPYQTFLIEEFVRSEQGEYKIPVDYKLSLFNGELAVINVINRMSPKAGLSSSYDENWNMLEDICQLYQHAPYQEPPACLPEMISFAKKLSKAYEIFIRIDFYATDKGAVFGEFTPTPGRGNGFTAKADQMLSDYWNKYCPDFI